VVGEREATAGTINVRSRDAGELGESALDAFLARLAQENVPGGGAPAAS
jgi:threonyl-tRNA synthetase